MGSPKRSKRNRVIKTLLRKDALPVRYGLDEIDTCAMVKEGLPYEAVERLVEQDRLKLDELSSFIAPRTLARRKQSKKLSLEESDTITRLSLVFDFAEDVFGSEAKAKIWLRRPNKALKDHTPMELLVTDYGSRIVERVLGRIEHGVYS
jgi:putative toxin-antitoxin system antitoxin component (TIGR02293 family)